jgi:hypothetical protein
MSLAHRELAAGRWNELSLCEQLGNVGSEVERALKWRAKHNPEYCLRAADRALELLDLTMACPENRVRLKEIARTREVLVDFFYGENRYRTSGEYLSRYFLPFAVAARRCKTFD